ncbi:hypothetical protein MFIFM68171_01719 [Madurella fahalii]|uniref:Uncharacterized protein n=1 Tax=Madurella fahalii TaxID=1157608 RepID=A0ABQ0G182_9PEZI
MDIVNEHVFFQLPEGHGWQSKPELPTAQEVLAPQPEHDDLPGNPVDKPWPSKNEYLTAQYEILRREAVEGLRYSVNSYARAHRARREMMEDDHTCIYTEVRVKEYQFTTIGPIARVSFSTRRSRFRIQWQLSKRLQPGKVVALSTKDDGFKNICKIATIAQRPYRDGLDQDPPLVDLLWANPEDAILDPDLEMVMVESWHGYYEAARHALVGLQHAARTDSPLDKYLTGAHTEDTLPVFIQQNPLMDLSSLAHNVDEAGFSAITALKAYDMVNGGIPDCGNLTLLDESQLSAVHRILSNELAVVQGPPGTGKTFTSVEAIRVMVENRRRNGGPPIVVAAQTNHALDQILGHCINFGGSVLRMGGRTQSEVIRERTVYQLRLRHTIPADRKCAAIDRKRHDNVDAVNLLINDLFGDRLLEPEVLHRFGIISDAQFQSLHDDTIETHPAMESHGPFALWLGDSLIPAHLLRDRHPTNFELNEAQIRKDLPEFEYDEEEMENIADDEEDENRFHGPTIELMHVWSGKNPAGLSAWNRAVVRALAKNDDLYAIDPELRGAVYQHFQAKLLQAMTPRFAALLAENVDLCKKRRSYKFLGNIQLVQNQGIDIVGCTTTGLTKYRGCLAAMRPRSLLIEEAAETREANIASALYPSVQQLILVGDHKQLAPKCDIQWLGDAPYNLNVSMFQRMVNLNVPFVMLKEQRRMKPELRFILNPFYPELVDHHSVESLNERPDVPGMGGRNCWFFDHTWPEDTNSDFSKFNEQEADMITNFFAYLVSNGTPAERITVLTFYKGQRKVLLAKLRRHSMLVGSAFNVCTVDSYQGEENDVVLLSLVRSPQLDRSYAVGFLEDERRAVVAISRARRGFYVFGNVENVLRAHDGSFNLWSRIWYGFPEQNRACRCRGLPLVCQPHGEEIWIKEVDEWGGNAGGCDKQCLETRPCGHQCSLKCHATPHEQLSCSHACLEVLPCGHGCQKRCSLPCFCDCKAFEEMTRVAQAAARKRVPLEQRLIQMGGQQSEMLLASLNHRNASFQQPRAVNTPLTPQYAGGAIQPTILNESSHSKRATNPQPGRIVNRDQMNQTAAQWREYVRNVDQADRRLDLERERISGAARESQAMAIRDVHRRTTLVDGRRVEDRSKTVQHIHAAAHPVSTVSRSGPPGNSTALLANAQFRLQNLTLVDEPIHTQPDHPAMSLDMGGQSNIPSNAPKQLSAQNKHNRRSGKRNRKSKNSRTSAEDDQGLPPAQWLDYDPTGRYDKPKRTLPLPSAVQSQGAAAKTKAIRQPLPSASGEKAPVMRILPDGTAIMEHSGGQGPSTGSRAPAAATTAIRQPPLLTGDKKAPVMRILPDGTVTMERSGGEGPSTGSRAPAPERGAVPDLLTDSVNEATSKGGDEEEEWRIEL